MRKHKYSLCTGRRPVYLNQPDFKALVQHEVKAKELEALVGQVLCADGWLDACETAPVETMPQFVRLIQKLYIGVQKSKILKSVILH